VSAIPADMRLQRVSHFNQPMPLGQMALTRAARAKTNNASSCTIAGVGAFIALLPSEDPPPGAIPDSGTAGCQPNNS
jgi:hypothetical protein